MEQYYNKINVSFNKDALNNVTIVKIKKPEKDTFSVLKEINYRKHVLGVVYDNNLTCYALIDLPQEKINTRNLFPNNPNYCIELCNNIDDNTLLNLILASETSKLSNNEQVINSDYYCKIQITKTQIITLHFYFKDYVFHSDVVTFTLNKILPENKRNKKGLFILGDTTMERVFEKDEYNEDELYSIFQRQKQKSNVKAISFVSGQEEYSKLYGMCKIMELLQNNKFINEINFCKIDVEEYHPIDLAKLNEQMNNYVDDFLKTHILNIIVDDDYKNIVKTIFEKYNIVFNTDLTDDLNIRFLNHTIEDENEEDDIIYQQDKASNKVVQHINVAHLLESEVQTIIACCLKELVIKYESHNKFYNIFDNNSLQANKTYKFYIKEKNTKENTTYFSMIEVDTLGNILNVVKNEELEFDENCYSFLDFEDCHHIIVDNLGNKLFIKNHNLCIVPNQQDYLNEVNVQNNKNKTTITLIDLKDIYETLIIKNPKEKDAIEKIMNTIFTNDISLEQELLISDLKDKKYYSKINDNGNKVSLETKLNKELLLKFNAPIKTNYKTMRNILFPSIQSIHYCDKFYIVAENTSANKHISTNIHLHEYSVEGNNIITEILPMLFTPLNCYKKLSSYPVFYKYLKEFK